MDKKKDGERGKITRNLRVSHRKAQVVVLKNRKEEANSLSQ